MSDALLALDYTTRARPLTIGDVKHDVDEFYVKYLMEVDKIIMWQHQLDWLVKATGQTVAPHLEAGIRIWAIPLEVRK
jgi:hypothetical protein